MEKIPVLVVAGPTASGKTALAVELAKKYNGEVVSADSMQIYKGMDIGTAKPTEEEMAGIRHHMIGVADPRDNFSVADYVMSAHKIIEDIAARKKTAIVAGGTGLYINSLIDDVDFSEEPEDGAVRRELYELAKTHGNDAVFSLLRQCDPESAAAIHPNNLKRVVRAVEYFRINGSKISDKISETQKKESRYRPVMLMLNPPRDELYAKIERRVDMMMSAGLIDEVVSLKKAGLNKFHRSMQGIGYKEVLDYLAGFSTKEEMTSIIKKATRRYAKRQLTWFRRDKRMIYLEDDLLRRASGAWESAF